MPIYRIRDGYENLAKNDEQFIIARNVLIDKKKLCVMPEGNHGNQHKLRPLVKGIFRIAFSAEEALAGTAHVSIVPVSLDLNFFQHSGADIVIKYGKPIKIENYFSLYQENQANAFNILRSDLSGTLSKMMHDIRSTDNYDLIYHLCCFGTPAYLEIQVEKGNNDLPKSGAGRNFLARKAIGLKLDEIDIIGSDKLKELGKLCNKLDMLPGYPSEITDLMELKPNLFTISLNLILTLLFLPGFVMDTPALFLNRFICKKISDKQMHNTYAFVVGLLVLPLIYLIITIVLSSIFGYGMLKAIILFFLLLTIGIVSERLRQYLRIPFRYFVFSFGKRHEFLRRCRNDYRKLKNLLKEMLQ